MKTFKFGCFLLIFFIRQSDSKQISSIGSKNFPCQSNNDCTGKYICHFSSCQPSNDVIPLSNIDYADTNYADRDNTENDSADDDSADSENINSSLGKKKYTDKFSPTPLSSSVHENPADIYDNFDEKTNKSKFRNQPKANSETFKSSENKKEGRKKDIQDYEQRRAAKESKEKNDGNDKDKEKERETETEKESRERNADNDNKGKKDKKNGNETNIETKKEDEVKGQFQGSSSTDKEKKNKKNDYDYMTDKQSDKNKEDQETDKNKEDQETDKSKKTVIETDKDNQDKGTVNDIKTEKGKPTDKSKDIEKDEDKEKGKETDKDKQTDKGQDFDKVTNKSKDTSISKDTEKGKDTDVVKQTDKDKNFEKDKQTNKDQDTEKVKNKSKDTNMNKDAEENKQTDKDKDNGEAKDTWTDIDKENKDKGTDKETDKEIETDKDIDKYKLSDKDKQPEKETDKDKESDKDKQSNNDKQSNKDTDKGKESDKEIDKSVAKLTDTNKQIDKGVHKDKEADKDKQIDKDKEDVLNEKRNSATETKNKVDGTSLEEQKKKDNDNNEASIEKAKDNGKEIKDNDKKSNQNDEQVENVKKNTNNQVNADVTVSTDTWKSNETKNTDNQNSPVSSTTPHDLVTNNTDNNKEIPKSDSLTTSKPQNTNKEDLLDNVAANVTNKADNSEPEIGVTEMKTQQSNMNDSQSDQNLNTTIKEAHPNDEEKGADSKIIDDAEGLPSKSAESFPNLEKQEIDVDEPGWFTKDIREEMHNVLGYWKRPKACLHTSFGKCQELILWFRTATPSQIRFVTISKGVDSAFLGFSLTKNLTGSDVITSSSEFVVEDKFMDSKNETQLDTSSNLIDSSARKEGAFFMMSFTKKLSTGDLVHDIDIGTPGGIYFYSNGSASGKPGQISVFPRKVDLSIFNVDDPGPEKNQLDAPLPKNVTSALKNETGVKSPNRSAVSKDQVCSKSSSPGQKFLSPDGFLFSEFISCQENGSAKKVSCPSGSLFYTVLQCCVPSSKFPCKENCHKL